MNIELNNKVLDLIYNSVKSEGGDGDAIWLCKYSPLELIKGLIRVYDSINSTGWSITNETENSFLWGNDQEWAIITDSQEEFQARASWIILKLDY